MTTRNETPRNIAKAHCQSCGSTSPEDVGYDAMRDNDGYTACCNERLVSGGRSERIGFMGRIERGPSCAERGDCYHE